MTVKVEIKISGDVKLTQTNAILRHISRKHGLDGKSDAEKDRVDLMENQVMDFRLDFIMLSYNPNFVIIFVFC
jgi:glutathione S-transferase